MTASAPKALMALVGRTRKIPNLCLHIGLANSLKYTLAIHPGLPQVRHVTLSTTENQYQRHPYWKIRSEVNFLGEKASI
jgi:hypothetical protein